MSGRLILMGSGELAPTMVRVHRLGIRGAGADRVVVIDSPFGFQENVSQLTDRISHFFRTSLKVEPVVGSYLHPTQPDVVRERFVATLTGGRYLFAGPGSPSYALDRWTEVGAGAVMADLLAEGGTVALASAAALTAGAKTIPVYEMYKVGADPYWLDGLDLTAPFGFSMAVVPHWNNREGGDHDTSHCYIGTRRFERLRSELTVGVLGVDEHTAAVLDFESGELSVAGVGGVTVEGSETVALGDGDTLPLERLAELVGRVAHPPVRSPSRHAPGVEEALASHDADALLEAVLALESESADGNRRAALRTALVQTVDAARSGLADPRAVVGGYVDLLLATRATAREGGDYEQADWIRDGLAELGVEVHDSPDGTWWDLSPR